MVRNTGNTQSWQRPRWKKENRSQQRQIQLSKENWELLVKSLIKSASLFRLTLTVIVGGKIQLTTFLAASSIWERAAESKRKNKNLHLMLEWQIVLSENLKRITFESANFSLKTWNYTFIDRLVNQLVREINFKPNSKKVYVEVKKILPTL